jgi:transcriptional regulator with XRE-family HTH domain
MKKESNKIRELREASGLTQIELAKRADLDRTRVSLWESGYIRLSGTEERRVRTVILDAARERVITLQTAMKAV